MKIKNILKYTFLSLFLFMSSCSLAPFCDHTYDSVEVIKEPTCLEKGRGRAICSKCNITYIVDIDALGHDLIYHDGLEATCENLGYEPYYDCSRCDYTTYKTIDKKDHTYSDSWSYDETKHFHKSTCSHDLIKDEEPHDFIEAVIKDATHDADGESMFSCVKCGYSYTSKIDKLTSHVYNKSVVDEKYLKDEATCHSLATYYKSCICGESSNSETFTFGDYKPHSFNNYVDDNNATCSKDGTKTSKCDNCEATNTISILNSKTPHNYEVLYTSSDISKSIYQCVDCNIKYFNINDKIVDYQSLGTSYDMYNSFSKYTNKKDLQDFYNEIILHLVYFLYDYSTYSSTNDTICKINFKDYDLSTNEALAVYSAIDSDWPILYFVSNSVAYDTNSLYFKLDSEYYYGSNRKTYYERIQSGINTYLDKVKLLDNKDDISIVKYTYEYIINKTNYAYEAPGVPSTKLKAHSVFGFFNNENVVCEGYAKTLQLLLNIQGIENCFVTGVAGDLNKSEDHAWNQVKINGNWYLIDATWDDTSEGANYKHFLITSNEIVNEVRNIRESNIENGLKYQYDVPSLSTKPIEGYVSLYKEDEYIGQYYVDEALSLINDSNSNYSIYLYDKEKNQAVFGKYIITKTTWPSASSISFFGYKDDKTTLTLPSHITLYSNIIFNSVSFKDDVDGLISVNGKEITFNSVQGEINHKIIGNESSSIVLNEIKGVYLNELLYFNNEITINNITSTDSSYFFVNNLTVNNLTIKGGCMTIHNLYYKKENEQSSIQVSITNVNLVTYILEDESMDVAVLNITSYDDQEGLINVNIKNVKTNNINNSIRINCSNVSCLPKVKIEGKISDTFVFAFIGFTRYLKDNINGVYYEKYLDPLSYKESFVNIGNNKLNDIVIFVSTSKSELKQLDNVSLIIDASGNISFK